MYNSKTKMVRKGTVGKASHVGYYNFYYPDEVKECTFLSDAIVLRPPWTSQKGLVAVRVMGSFLEGSGYMGDKRYVVWVKPTDIECY